MSNRIKRYFKQVQIFDVNMEDAKKKWSLDYILLMRKHQGVI